MDALSTADGRPLPWGTANTMRAWSRPTSRALMTVVDVVIPAHPKDFAVLTRCVRSVLRWLEPVGRVHIVSTEPFVTKDPRVAWVPESSATSLPTAAQLRERLTRHGPAAAARAAWIYQQILKLGVPEYVPDISAAYMLVDADVIWLRPWRIVVDDRIRFPFTHATEYHLPYRDAYYRLFGVQPQAPFSLTAHQMVYDQDLLAQMKLAIEARHGVRGGRPTSRRPIRWSPLRSASWTSSACGCWTTTRRPPPIAR